MECSLDLDTYLERIGLATRPAVDERGLRDLHDAQFLSLPFENFDIQLGRGISLEPGRLVQKLVHTRRGGYCFELNGLMLLALQAAGFTARPLLARVHLQAVPSGRTHQLNLVELGTRSWIIDVGFGAGGLRCPLPLEPGFAEEGSGWGFRLVEQAPWGIMMQSREDGAWKDSYSFDLCHVTPADIAVSNHYTSTSPNSHFVTGRIASRPLATGRVSVRDFTLTRIENGRKSTRELPDDERYLAELGNAFGIELEAGYGALRPVAGS